MQQVDTTNIKTRLENLSPQKQRLLALRLGMSTDTPQDKSQQKTLAAFVTASTDVDDSTLRSHLRERLPQYMIPSSITVLDVIPRTPNGKVDRDALMSYVDVTPEVKEATSSDTDAPDEIEAHLMQIWEELLGMDMIGVDDDFFELGGYSLLAIRMLGQIKEAFDKELPPSIILEAPTIRILADRLRDDAGELAAQTIFALQPEGDLPPVYTFQVHKYGVITYRYIAEHLAPERPVYGVALPQDMDETPNTVEGLAAIFIESLLHHQPEGPYYLSGMSIAGLIAYEVARQLKARGIDDVHVLLFDTYGPTYPQMISTKASLRQKAQLHIQKLTHASTDKTTYARELLWRNWYRLQYRGGKYINRYLRRLGLKEIPVPDEDEPVWTPGQPVREFAGKKVYGEMIELLELEERYFAEPKPYTGHLILYRSTLQPMRAAYNETLGWEKFMDGDITVRHVRGNHSGILRFPFVESLAKQVNQDLVASESSSS